MKNWEHNRKCNWSSHSARLGHATWLNLHLTLCVSRVRRAFLGSFTKCVLIHRVLQSARLYSLGNKPLRVAIWKSKWCTKTTAHSAKVLCLTSVLDEEDTPALGMFSFHACVLSLRCFVHFFFLLLRAYTLDMFSSVAVLSVFCDFCHITLVKVDMNAHMWKLMSRCAVVMDLFYYLWREKERIIRFCVEWTNDFVTWMKCGTQWKATFSLDYS